MVVAKPLTTGLVARTEKKMDMTLDDIIKTSKNTTPRKQRWVPKKSQKFSNAFTENKSSKVRRYMDSRSSVRQGVIAKRRSSFWGNQFPHATDVARKAFAAPLHYRVSNRNRVASWNKARFRIPASQRRAATGGFAAKQPQPFPQHKQEGVNIIPRQRRQTLDSRFANMKEQRMRLLSRQNNAVQHNGAGSRRPPWGRGRFDN